MAGSPSRIWDAALGNERMAGLLGVGVKERGVFRGFSVSVKQHGPVGGPSSSNPCHPAISCIYPGRGLRVCTEVPGRGPPYGPGRVPPGQGERTCHHLHR